MSCETSEPRALTEAEFAKRLRLSLATVRRWRQTRSGPIQPLPRLGKSVRYSEAQLNRYLEGLKK